MLQVKRGQQYALILRSETKTGCYGIEVGNLISAKGTGSAESVNSGKSFKIIPGQSIRFKTFIKTSNK